MADMPLIASSGPKGDSSSSEHRLRALFGGKGFKPGDDSSRVEAYQARWQAPLDLLSLLTIWLVVVPPGVTATNHDVYEALIGLRLALSAIYGVDLIVRSRLAPHHWYYVQHNLPSLATVAIPTLRVVLSLRLLRSVFQRGNIDRFVLVASLMFLNLTAVVYLYERHAAHSNIKSVGNALWWAVVTLTTVGYGDYTPVTPQGRTAAAVLMFVGFAVLATVTAHISSSFIDQAARTRADQSAGANPEQENEESQLQAINEELRLIRQQIGGSSANQ